MHCMVSGRISVTSMDIPIVSVEQMRVLDARAVEWGLSIPMMMEHAGLRTAELARMLLGTIQGKQVLVLAGKGHNGGDALVAARFLHTWGVRVTVIAAESEMAPVTHQHFEILKKMELSIHLPESRKGWEQLFQQAELVVDGLLGYNLKGDPRGLYAELIELANSSGKPILAIDSPSGLDAQTGEARNPCIRATATLALTLPKKGLIEGREHAGEVYVGEIGIPAELHKKLGLTVGQLFSEKSIIRF